MRFSFSPKQFASMGLVRTTQDDHNNALTLCHWHRDLLSDDDYIACNEVARGWGNNELVDAKYFARFQSTRARIRTLVHERERYWCGCGCEDRKTGHTSPAPEKREPNEQERRQAEILEALPTAEVDAWIFAHTKYTPETFAALGKATRRDRRREARRQMEAGGG